MTMDPVSVTLLAIAGTMVIGFGGIVVTIHSTANATNRRMEDFREDVDRRFGDLRQDMDRRFDDSKQIMEDFKENVNRRFEDVDRKLGDLRTDFRDMRGRVDYIADSLSLGRVARGSAARRKKQA